MGAYFVSKMLEWYAGYNSCLVLDFFRRSGSIQFQPVLFSYIFYLFFPVYRNTFITSQKGILFLKQFIIFLQNLDILNFQKMVKSILVVLKYTNI